MRLLAALLVVLSTTAFAQLLDVHFGTTQIEELTVDSLCHIESDSLLAESIFMDWFSCGGNAHVWGTFHVDSTLVLNEQITLEPVRGADAYWYGIDVDGAGFFSGGAAEKTYMMNLSGTRVAADTMSGDSRDRLIGGAYSNYAANDANSNVHGIGMNIRNRSTGFMSVIRGIEMGVKNDSGGEANYLQAGTFTCENYGTVNDMICGLYVDLRNEGPAATGEFGIKIVNTDNSTANRADAAIFIDDDGTNLGWDYGLNMIGATIGTAEIAGSNGETINNVTDGYWHFGEAAMLAASYNFATAAMVGGTADAITINFTPDMATLAAGSKVTFVAEGANTGAATLAIDGGAAKAIVESADASALEANDIRSGCVVELIYDGTSWQQTSQSGN